MGKRKHDKSTRQQQPPALEYLMNYDQFPRLQKSVNIFEDAIYTYRKHRRDKCIRNIYSLKCLSQEGIKKLLRIVKGSCKLTKPAVQIPLPSKECIYKYDCHQCAHSECPIHSENPEYDICVKQRVEDVAKSNRMFMCPELDKNVDVKKYPFYLQSLKDFKGSLEPKECGRLCKVDYSWMSSKAKMKYNQEHAIANTSITAGTENSVNSSDLKHAIESSTALNSSSFSFGNSHLEKSIINSNQINSNSKSISHQSKKTDVQNKINASQKVNDIGAVMARRQMASDHNRTNVHGKGTSSSIQISNSINDSDKTCNLMSDSDKMLRAYMTLNALVTDKIFSETVLNVDESPKSSIHENSNQNAKKHLIADPDASFESIDIDTEHIFIEGIPDDAPTPLLDDQCYLPIDKVEHIQSPDIFQGSSFCTQTVNESRITFPDLVRHGHVDTNLSEAAANIYENSKQQMLSYTENMQQKGWYLIPVFVPQTENYDQMSISPNTMDPRNRFYEHQEDLSSQKDYSECTSNVEHCVYLHNEETTLQDPSSSRYTPDSNISARSHLRSNSSIRSRSRLRSRSPLRSRSRWLRSRSPLRSRSRLRSRSPLRSRSRLRSISPLRSRSRLRSRSPLRSRQSVRSRSTLRSRSRSRSSSRNSYYSSFKERQRSQYKVEDRRETRRSGRFERKNFYRRSTSIERRPYRFRTYTNSNQSYGKTRNTCNNRLRARQRILYSPKRYSIRKNQRR